MYDLYTGLLKMFDQFQNDDIDIKIRYEFIENEELLKKYSLVDVAGKGTTFEKVTRLLEWESSHICHCGNYDNHVKNNAMDLFSYAFDKGIDFGINCRSLSIALVECLLTLKIKARVIYIMPMSPYDGDNHVVCEAYIDELNKWVMFDPTYNTYIMDENNNLLGVLDLRNNLKEQKKIHFSENINYNGKKITSEESLQEVINYYAKDMFYFIVDSIQGKEEIRKESQRIYISPVGFNAKNNAIYNINYRRKLFGGNEYLDKWLKSEEELNYIYKNTYILE